MEILFLRPMFGIQRNFEELFTRLNPNRKLRLERERLAREEAAKHPELNEETEQV